MGVNPSGDGERYFSIEGSLTGVPAAQLLPVGKGTTLPFAVDSIGYAAWWYARKLGWHVFPVHTPTAEGVCSCGNPQCHSVGKHPRTPNGLGDASCDPAQVTAWWRQWPDANIGLACGASGLVALDFDTAKPDFAGQELLNRLLADAPTTTARSGSGGYHLLYRQPTPALGDSKGALPRGIDVKGKGYVILQPSLHKSGNQYQWEPGYKPNLTPPAPVPAEVVALIQQTKHVPPTTPRPVSVVTGGDDVEKARGWLARLAPWRADDYGVDGGWVAVGMALAELGAAGLALWEEWSKRSPKYTPGECARKWGTFKPGAGKRLGSLKYWADQDDPCGAAHGVVNGTGPAADAALAVEGLIPPNADGADGADGADDSQELGESGKGARKRTQAEILYKLASEHAEIFTGQDGLAYGFVPVDGRRECYRLKDEAFAGWLTALYRVKMGDAMPGAEGRKEAVAALTWDARTTRRDVFVRVGACGGKVYLDLGTTEWDAIEIDGDGWRMVATPPVAFRRPGNLKPLPLPLRGATLDLLRSYVNVENDDWPLVAAWMVAAANPTGPYPILVLAGEQGTAKSTTIRVLKETLDPTTPALRGQPEDVRDLWVGANNGWLLAYDNVSHLNNDVSDALCRLATGGGYAKRANYSDDGEIVMDATRPVAVNGIGDIVTRPDLMDRALLICPPVIGEGKRRNEKEFWAAFDADRPKLLGALLDAVAVALCNINDVHLDDLPRMADFARLAVAAQPALGGTVSFLDAYHANREEAHATVVETSTLGEHLRALVLVSGTWEGTASELLQNLNERATESEKRSRAWPNVPNRVKPALQRLAPSLRHIGVEVEFPPRSDKGGTRRIRLVRLNG
jgi:hypothetical protein